MASKKIFVVFGVTGNQGGSVVNSVLGDQKTANEFRIRGITRDPSKPKAKALEARGVECVAADTNSKEELKAALQGAYAVFAVTNYWERMDAEYEVQQGRNIADAAKETGVQHLIWSALYDITKLSGGKYSMLEHFDSKAHVDQYIRDIGVPSTSFMPGFYMSGFTTGMFQQLPPNNDWALTLPMPLETPIPCFDATDDTGKFVKAILTHRDQLLGKRVFAATDYYTPEQVVSTFAELHPKSGAKMKYIPLTKEQYTGGLAQAGLPPKVQEELYQTMMFMNEFGYYGKASLDGSLALLDEKPTTLKEFFAKAKAFEGIE